MNLKYGEGYTMKDFLFANRDHFEARLLEEAINVRYKIEEIHRIGNINLVDNAHKMVLYIVEERDQDLINFAIQEGVVWAKYSLTLAFKLEWVQAIRRTLWDFLYNFDVFTKAEENRAEFYNQEKRINVLMDQFFSNFFISYSKYKDEMLAKQRKLVENLSVPIIPISNEVCVLPLIGSLDPDRLTIIEDKVLKEIESRAIETLIIDLSGVTPMDEEAVSKLGIIINAIFLMGCKTIITGLRKEVVMKLRNPVVKFSDQVEYRGTLQLAMNDVIYKNSYLG